MNKQYRKQIEQILIDNEIYTAKQMKTVYKTQKQALKVLEERLGALFIKYGVNGTLKMTSKQKAGIGLKQILKTMAKDLGTSEIAVMTSILGEVYLESYYKNAFLLNTKFNIVKKEFVDAAVNQKFKGSLFSKRIWINKADMIDKLQTNLTDAMKGKTTIDKVARDIKNTFNVKAYESKRLVNTEMSRIQTQASYDIGIDSGVDEVMWSATLDNLTATDDADLDGIVWGIKENHPTPPLHPNCRCTLINVPYKGWQPTSRKDNISKEVIDYKSYNEWKNK